MNAVTQRENLLAKHSDKYTRMQAAYRQGRQSGRQIGREKGRQVHTLKVPKREIFVTELFSFKAVNREDKRSRRYRDRHFAKFERSRRYRDRTIL